MYPEDRSRGFPLQERSQNIRNCLFLMTVFPHWIIRQMLHLRKALKKKTQESTVLIVAQRISTILHAEQIIVLDEGKIAGIGTHRELLENCEVYRQIAASQLSESELEFEWKGG